jgi:hypothetical protein
MKILFIGTPRFDYLQDLTYSGLVKILGRKNIIEYKVNPYYHFPVKKYPKNLGYNGLDLSFLYNLSIKDIDCVFVAAAKPLCFEMYLQVLPKLKPTVKTIFLDGGDVAEIGGDLKRLHNPEIYNAAASKRPFDIIFKREYLKNTSYEPHIHPLPFSINPRIYSQTKKQEFNYDVSFWAVESHQIRTQALTLMQDKFDCAANGSTRNQTFTTYKRKGQFYFDELSRCKILLNFRGGGWDTLRYWEVMGLGRFMITQELGIVIPNDYQHGKEIVCCKPDLSDLEELCRYYLQHAGKREKIAKQGLIKSMQFHTVEARAKYILSIIAK